MTWVALLLVGVAVADLVRAVRPVPVVEECVGAAAAVCVGLLAGLTGPRDVLALAVIAAVVVAWAQTVRRALRGAPAWWPLATLAAALVLALLVSGWAGRADGLLGAWLDHTRVPSLKGVSADRVLLVAGVFLANLATGNVLVHLVLGATGTVSPAVQHTDADPEEQLKGGRLLGPMERLFIVGLGLAGEWTAASIVVAAKGLLRWPELQSRREQGLIHQLTEYFLVGSFVSWLVALTSLALLAR